jgi:hypothetical protein
MQLGKFFGELEGASTLMKQLIAEDSGRPSKTSPSKHVFRRSDFALF